jgi:hypothetical protein
VLALALNGGEGWVLFGLLAALVGLVLAIGWRLSTAVGTELASNDFGLCPGIRQLHSKSEAFTDWLARLIDEAAGRSEGTDRPLTFGELAALPGDKAIRLAMMTTSLMEQ